jgi:hypothetical protein
LLTQALLQACQQLSTLTIKTCRWQLAKDGLEKGATEIFGKATSRTSVSVDDPSTDPDGCFRALGRISLSMLSGITKLSGKDNEIKNLGAVVYAFIVSFKAILSCLSDTAKAVAAAEDAVPRGNIPLSNSKSKVTTATKNQSQDLLSHIYTLLNTLLLNLMPGDAAHREVFEGLTYILVDRVARQLYRSTFGHEKNEKIEDDITMLCTEGTTAAKKGTPDLDNMAFELEAPYTIALFERCCSLATAHFNSTFNTRLSRAKAKRPSKSIHRAPAYSGKSALNIRTRERLQQTLMNCMFGEAGRQDEFMDCLRMPMKITVPSASKRSKQDKNICNWFENEMWRILGWEILSRSTELTDASLISM